MTTTLRDIAGYIESATPPPLPGDEFGLVHGSLDRTVRKAGILWRLSRSILRGFANEGVDAIVVHERIYQKEIDSNWYAQGAARAQSLNDEIRDLLNRNDIAVVRYHSNLDAWPVHGVADLFGPTIGLKHRVGGGAFSRVYELSSSSSICEVAMLLERSHPDAPVRILGDPAKLVTRVGVLIGGFGGNQAFMPQEAFEAGAECLIVGDLVERILLNSLDLGMPVIETLHSVTEEPTMRRLSEILQGQYPDVEFTYRESGAFVAG